MHYGRWKGVRFAKRDRAQTLRALREAGVSPDEVRRRVGMMGPD